MRNLLATLLLVLGVFATGCTVVEAPEAKVEAVSTYQQDVEADKQISNSVDRWVEKQLSRDTASGMATSMTYVGDIFNNDVLANGLTAKHLAKDLMREVGNTGWTRTALYGDKYAVVVEYKIDKCETHFIAYIMDLDTFFNGNNGNSVLNIDDLLLNDYVSINMDYRKHAMCTSYDNCKHDSKYIHDEILDSYSIEHIVSK